MPLVAPFQSRARDTVFTVVCVLTAAIAVVASIATALIHKGDWGRSLFPFLFRGGELAYDFDLLLLVAEAVEGALLLLAMSGYLLSLDLFRSRRPVARVHLLIFATALFPAAIGVSNSPNELLVWLAAIAATLILPLLLLGLERLLGAGLIAMGRWARRREWWEFSGMALRQGLRMFSNSQVARRDYGMVLRSLGDVTLARGLLEPLFDEGVRDEELVEVLSELALSDEDWASAVERLEALRESRPDDRDVIFHLALAHSKLGQYEQARQMLEALAPEKRTTAMAELMEQCARALKDLDGALAAVKSIVGGMAYEKARERYESLLKDFPGMARIHCVIADLAHERRRPAEEAAWLEKAVELAPEDWATRLRLAGLYRELSRPDLEVRHLEPLVKQRPEPDAESLIAYSRLLADRGQHVEGIGILERHAGRFPDDIRFTLAMARHYMSLGNLDRAAEKARLAVEQAKRAAEAAAPAVEGAPAAPAAVIVPFGSEARSLLRRIEKAVRAQELETAQRVAEAAPDDADVSFRFLSLLAEHDEVETCVRELDGFAARHPELKARVQQEALAFVQRTERPFLIYSYLSDLALQDREYARALELYKTMSERSLHPREIVGDGCQRILALQPDFLPARAMLAEFHVSRGEWRAALETLAPYFDNGGEHTREVDRAMFTALCKIGDLEGAAHYLDLAMAHTPHDIEPLTTIAGAYEAQGKNHDAAEALRRAVRIDGRNLSIYERLQQVDAKIREERYFELRDLLDREPENPANNMEMGDLFLYRGEFLRAVSHFQMASRDPALANLCAAKQIVCLARRRLYDLAEEQLALVSLDAVSDPNLREIKGLVYALGAAYEADNMRERALAVYKRIFRVDAGFRDVAQKMESMTV